jgi:hypothetical protein
VPGGDADVNVFARTEYWRGTGPTQPVVAVDDSEVAGRVARPALHRCPIFDQVGEDGFALRLRRSSLLYGRCRRETCGDDRRVANCFRQYIDYSVAVSRARGPCPRVTSCQNRHGNLHTVAAMLENCVNEYESEKDSGSRAPVVASFRDFATNPLPSCTLKPALGYRQGAW